ncbi:MAG: GtrA family protein [Bacteroidaceae bacterium]|nr:GtrA family protein [Bacteroidaceae bacterium]
MKLRQLTGEALRFGIVGMVATVLHYLIYNLLVRWLPANLAYTIGYGVGFLCNFFATSYFTFHSTPSWGKLVGMGGAHGVNYLLHMVLLNAFLLLGVPKLYAPFPVFAIAIPVNFLLVRFVFRNRKKDNNPQ